MVSSIILALVSIFFILASPAGAGTINVNCPGDSLQAAINAAPVDTAINVSGTCNENILVDNDKIKIYIIGSTPNRGATINGPDPSKHVFDVRGKAILIQNLTITGGRQGIAVQRGSNAVVLDNLIHFTGNQGISVSQLAYANIRLNTIEDNPSNGISIAEGSTARIGFNNNNDANASPNIIRRNNRGILVQNSSHATVAGNFINNNTLDGITVTRNSQVDAASNAIDNNGQDGVNVSDNSEANLGEDNPTSFLDDPNTTTVNNTRNGIRCIRGGVVRGHLGATNQLNGNVEQFGGGTPGTNSFHNTCPNGTTNLDVP